MRILACLILISTSTWHLRSAAAQMYTIQELPPPAGMTHSYAFGINDAGVVCGQVGSGNSFPAALWVQGAPQVLGTLLGQPHGMARDINASNQVVGWSYGPVITHPFFWENGVLTQLPVPGSLDSGWPMAINDSGRVAGFVVQQSGMTKPCMWERAAGQWAVSVLPDLGGTGFTNIALDVDSNGTVVGSVEDPATGSFYACRWDNQVLTLVAPVNPPGSPGSSAWGINDLGDILLGRVQGAIHEAHLLAGGVSVPLGAVPGYSHTMFFRLNDKGEAVGHAWNGDPWEPLAAFTDSTATVWRQGTLSALNGRLLNGGPEWDVRQAWDINASGTIAAFGHHWGQWRAMLLTPAGSGCPSPAIYCTAKTSSSSCLPAIGYSGNASPNGGFTLTCSSVEAAKFGLLFYGTSGSAAIPFQGGFLCAAPPLVRLGVQSSGGTASCTGAYSQPLAALIAAVPTGTTLNAQWWFRDPVAPSGTGLSNGLEFTTCQD